MTDLEKRIKVAEACGTLAYGFTPESLGGFVNFIPDYANSLDAMAEAEKVLTPTDFVRYRWGLWDMCKRTQVTEWNRAYISATAAQRFEAFGKTLNLW